MQCNCECCKNHHENEHQTQSEKWPCNMSCCNAVSSPCETAFRRQSPVMTVSPTVSPIHFPDPPYSFSIESIFPNVGVIVFLLLLLAVVVFRQRHKANRVYRHPSNPTPPGPNQANLSCTSQSEPAPPRYTVDNMGLPPYSYTMDLPNAVHQPMPLVGPSTSPPAYSVHA